MVHLYNHDRVYLIGCINNLFCHHWLLVSCVLGKLVKFRGTCTPVPLINKLLAPGLLAIVVSSFPPCVW